MRPQGNGNWFSNTPHRGKGGWMDKRAELQERIALKESVIASEQAALKALQAELDALPKEPVRLRSTGIHGGIGIFIEDRRNIAWVCNEESIKNGINPIDLTAHILRFNQPNPVLDAADKLADELSRCDYVARPVRAALDAYRAALGEAQ